MTTVIRSEREELVVTCGGYSEALRPEALGGSGSVTCYKNIGLEEKKSGNKRTEN